MIGSHVLTGYEPNKRGADALALALVVVRHTHGHLSVARIRPPAWPGPGAGKVDAEWDSYLDGQAHATLVGAADALEVIGRPRALEVRYLVGANRGSGRGLAHLVGRTKADLIVIGSAPGGPRHGVSLGSTADQLLHGSPVPVMVAPKGYSEVGLEHFDRITVAYLRRPSGDQAVAFAAQVAAARGVPLRLLSVAIGQPARGRASALAEEQLRRLVDIYEGDLVLAAKTAQTDAALTASLVQTEVARGPDAAKALATVDWTPGDLLVISASEAGPIRQVFMGDMSLKIMRAAPCPAVVLPRLTAR